ncbi:hypothetical protein NC651_014961 [Populus alba x Populus x berolinensis]|nr:hypothetical protein NC651_014956 [Populus alba x Populus x berolinensis]KAJ6912404.1 hypothetical protein NC651_014960 [Populus alba x Populus x berolinensis]KAJ6912405.1 hypothetical protein NC651_014961 [Populus alba x Populus x berolinensis]
MHARRYHVPAITHASSCYKSQRRDRVIGERGDDKEQKRQKTKKGEERKKNETRETREEKEEQRRELSGKFRKHKGRLHEDIETEERRNGNKRNQTAKISEEVNTIIDFLSPEAGMLISFLRKK